METIQTVEETPTNTTESGTTETDGLENPYEMSDEDLERILQGESEEGKASNGTAEKTAIQPDSKQATPPEQDQEGSPSKEEPSKEVTREEFDKQQRQLEGLELLVQRRTSDLATLRNKLAEVNDKLRKTLKEKFEESPEQALDIRDKIKENEALIAEAQTEEEQLSQVVEKQKLVSRYVKPGEVSEDDVVATLVGDGIPEQAARQYVKNPYVVSDPQTIIHLHNRAKAEAALRKLIPLTKALYDERKKSKNGAADVMKEIDRVARQTPHLTAASSGTVKASKSPNVDPAEMTDAEIEEFLKNV